MWNYICIPLLMNWSIFTAVYQWFTYIYKNKPINFKNDRYLNILHYFKIFNFISFVTFSYSSRLLAEYHNMWTFWRSCQFLNVMVKLVNQILTSPCLSAPPPPRMEQLCSHWKSLKNITQTFTKTSRCNSSCLNSDKIKRIPGLPKKKMLQYIT